MTRLLPQILALLLAFTCMAGELSISGTRFLLEGKPFPYTGLSFFNAIYNTNSNASAEARATWLRKFHDNGITVLRIWCQWDSQRGFVDASPSSTLYQPNGEIRERHLQTLKQILASADELGMCVELVLFSQESWTENIRISEPADVTAVDALTTELKPYRNLTFQIWNEHSDDRVIPLLRRIKSLDPKTRRWTTSRLTLPGKARNATGNLRRAS